MRRTLLAVAVAVVGTAATGLLGVPSAAAGGGGCGDDVSFQQGATTVVTEHACWGPTVTQVPVGQAVTFLNKSGIEHNITGPGPVGFHDFGAGASVQIAFPIAGIYPYACTLHPGMSGAVVVGNPLAAAVPAVPVTTAPAVSLSTTDADEDGSLLGTTPAVVGTGAVVAGALGTASFLVVRRRRTALPI